MKSLQVMLKAGFKDFKKTASFFPSSPVLVRHMVAPLRLERAKLVVEFGVGTGVVTEAILKRLRPSGRLIAFELNETLAAYARARTADPRLEIVTRGAERLLSELRARRLAGVDAIASSLGLSLMPDRTRHDILRASVAALRPRGVFTQFIYIHGTAVPFKRFEGSIQTFPAEEFLEDYFARIDRDWVFRNVPPAFVYACRGPIKEP
ncbi:MAG: methyltransferase domain-containing protein [Elusimicrobia bacterium]|nr:methyltransferase domain-containing protein [Elusimicrobiota bacterium]